MPAVEGLRKRSDFLRVAKKGRRAHSASFVLQAWQRRGPPTDVVRVGFTCSKKVGNAVARNRAKRRLREAARLSLPQYGAAGWDYVLIGRAGLTAATPFDGLLAELRMALQKVHQ